MCTVTWRWTAGGYELFCNRDELFTRLPAEPPALAARGTVRYLAPRDGDHGGTWVLVNELGVGLCLVNRAHLAPAALPAEPQSRGLLVAALADLAAADELPDRLGAQDLAAHRGFALLALEPGGATRLARWDGRELVVAERADAALPLFSEVPNEVAVRRGALLQQLAARHGARTSACLAAFHASHGDAAGPDSPCMHGPDGETQSHTLVRVERGAVSLRYAPGPPCRTPLGAELRLERGGGGAGGGRAG